MKKHNAEQLTLLSLLTEKTYHDGCVRLLIEEKPSLLDDKFYLNSKSIGKSYIECNLLNYVKLKGLNNPKIRFIINHLENIYKENDAKIDTEYHFYTEDLKNKKTVKFKVENKDLLLFLTQPSYDNNKYIEKTDPNSYSHEELKLLTLFFGVYSLLITSKEMRNKMFGNLIGEYKSKKSGLDIFNTGAGINHYSMDFLSLYMGNLPKEEIKSIIECKGKAEFFYDAFNYNFSVLTTGMIKNYPPEEWITEIKRNENINKKIKVLMERNGLYLLTADRTKLRDKENHLKNILDYLGNDFKKAINFDKAINKSIKDRVNGMFELFEQSDKELYVEMCAGEIKKIISIMDEFLLDNKNQQLIEKLLDLIDSDKHRELIRETRIELLSKNISNRVVRNTTKNKAKI